MNAHTRLPDATTPAVLLSVLPTDRELIAALGAQVSFLVKSMQSVLGHLDGKNYCGALRDVEFTLNSLNKMPAHRTKRVKR